MPLDLTPLDNASRLLVEAELQVATGGGGRFQPTGFPDLGPALFKGADGNSWLLVESPQSMANRMERVCWIDGDAQTDQIGIGRYNDDCHHIPFVLTKDADARPLTASTLEAHRIASPYIWDTQAFSHPDDAGKYVTLPDYLKEVFHLAENRLVPWKHVASGLLKVDPGCLLHGVWFNDGGFCGGKVRITRALSAYIEARDPSPANFGFQKRDSVSDRTDKEAGQSAAEGYGSVIGPKQQFTSAEIKAYFQLDLERLRSYGLPYEQVRALAAWAIYKIRRVLLASRDGIADLRTECKFEVSRRAANAPEPGNEQNTKNEEAVDSRLVCLRTGVKTPFPLPQIDDDLIHVFNPLKRREHKALEVKWIPNIEGKAEVTDELEASLKRDGLDGKSRFETKQPPKGKKRSPDEKPKRSFVIFGEWTAANKNSLRDQNPDEPAKSIIEKVIKDYEKKWEAKAQSRKPATDDDGQVGGEFE